MMGLRFKPKGLLAELTISAMLLVIVSCNDGGYINPLPRWGTAELIENTQDGVSDPQIVMDGTGTAIAVWKQLVASPASDIGTNRFDGTAWGTTELIGSNNATYNTHPRIAMDGTGTAIAVWQKDDGPPFSNIWANHFDGTAWGTAELIDTDLVDGVQIAMDGTGTAIAVWGKNDGTRGEHLGQPL